MLPIIVPTKLLEREWENLILTGGKDLISHHGSPSCLQTSFSTLPSISTIHQRALFFLASQERPKSIGVAMHCNSQLIKMNQ